MIKPPSTSSPCLVLVVIPSGRGTVMASWVATLAPSPCATPKAQQRPTKTVQLRHGFDRVSGEKPTGRGSCCTSTRLPRRVPR